MFYFQKFVIDSIIQIVEGMLSRYTQGKVLVIDLDFLLLEKETGELIKRKKIAYFFYRSMTYTAVSALEDSSRLFDNKERALMFLAYHDSCWRSDGISESVHTVFSSMKNYIREEKLDESSCEYSVEYGLFGVGLINGKLEINSNKQTSRFIPE